MDDAKYYVMLHLLEAGEPKAAIGRTLKLHRRTVDYWMKQGRPPSKKPKKERVTDTATLRRQRVAILVREKVRRIHTRFTPVRRKPVTRTTTVFPFDSASKIAREMNARWGTSASPSTIRLDLMKIGFRAKKRFKAPVLTTKDKALRVQRCRSFRREKPQIAFSDESNFDCNETGGSSAWQWVLPGEQVEPIKTEANSPSVTAWGCISTNFRFLIVLPSSVGRLTCEKYRKFILSPALKKLKELSRTDTAFQQDNAPCHRGSAEWLRRRGVKTLPDWPARSCDLNPIEALWGILKSRVARRGPFGEEMLINFIHEEFNALSDETINNCVDLFQERCRKCIAAGGNTVRS